MLNDILKLDQLQWRPSRSYFSPIPILTFIELKVVSMENSQRVRNARLEDLPFRAPCTELLLPSFFFLDLLMLQLLRPIFPNFPCHFPTFHIEYPLLLSRFCFPYQNLMFTFLSDWKKCVHQQIITCHKLTELSLVDFFNEFSKNTLLLYWEILQIWYFVLRLDYFESNYTPELPGFLYCFLLIFKQQCIKVWLCKPARCANKWSNRYLIYSKCAMKYNEVKQISVIYWTPKETLQSSLLYCFIKCDYITFSHLVKVVRDVLFFFFCGTYAKFEPCSVRQNLCRSIWTVCTTCTRSILPGIMKVKQTSTLARKYSKTTKNHQKLITKRIRKAPYLAQYTKIYKVIKRFRTAAFTDLDQCQFVLKLSRHLSFIILNLCTKWEETLTKMY